MIYGLKPWLCFNIMVFVIFCILFFSSSILFLSHWTHEHSVNDNSDICIHSVSIHTIAAIGNKPKEFSSTLSLSLCLDRAHFTIDQLIGYHRKRKDCVVQFWYTVPVEPTIRPSEMKKNDSSITAIHKIPFDRFYLDGFLRYLNFLIVPAYFVGGCYSFSLESKSNL